MQLEGKCKELFEEWLYNVRGTYPIIASLETEDKNGFYFLTDSMQWGVYQDFFDSIGFYIGIDTLYIKEFRVFVIVGTDEMWMDNRYETRPEARTAAIQKAMELVNQREI